MGAGVVVVHANRLLPGSSRACPRYLAKLYRAKAHAARLRFEHEYAWWRWLPAKFRRVGTCETGLRFDWTQPSYISAFGIYRGSWYAFGGSRWTGRNSPREQYEVADAIRARYGWGAWGCGGA
jgi:hypothetical protein